MISTKQSFIFQILFLVYLWHISSALRCKTCEKTDSACLLGENVETTDCINDNDLCYSWFDRTKSEVGVQRGCISPDMPEYKMINKLLGNSVSECVKRVNGLDCFKFCSLDECN